MSIAGVLLTTALALTSHTGHEAVDVPSDPKSWNVDFLGLPAGSEDCPGGKIDEHLKAVPQLQPQTPSQYEAAEETSLSFLLGLQQSDRLYPFYFRWDFAGGGFAGTGGFILVRGGCITHVQPTLFDN